jgi:hypothetical protein
MTIIDGGGSDGVALEEEAVSGGHGKMAVVHLIDRDPGAFE